jgi:hypothetical protein
MKESVAEYYVQVQRRKTIKYGPTQHYQDSVTIPAHVSEALKLLPKQILKCVLNANGNSLTYTKVTEKPSSRRMRYEDWRERIKAFTPQANPGKTYAQIRDQAGIPIKTAPSLWVRLAENDIGLKRSKDRKTHKILWSRAPMVTRIAEQKLKDMKLTDVLNQDRSSSDNSVKQSSQNVLVNSPQRTLVQKEASSE